MDRQFLSQGVLAALSDSFVSVRESALELVGQCVRKRPDLTLQYFDSIERAVADPGLSVRKRALKLLYENCILYLSRISSSSIFDSGCLDRKEDFPKRTDACLAVLSRVHDRDEHVQAFVREVFAELWFPPSVLAPGAFLLPDRRRITVCDQLDQEGMQSLSDRRRNLQPSSQHADPAVTGEIHPV